MATDHKIQGRIIYIDNFGNLISNIHADNLPVAAKFSCRLLHWRTNALTPTYALGNHPEPILTCGSFGLLEIALNGGSAADWFDIDIQQQPTAGITISFS